MGRRVGPRGDWLQCSIVIEKPGDVNGGTTPSDVPPQADGEVASKQSDLRASFELRVDGPKEERRGDEVHTMQLVNIDRLSDKKRSYWKKSALNVAFSSEPPTAYIKTFIHNNSSTFLSRSPSRVHSFTYFTMSVP